ncbi:hypothetical protein [Streptomyces albogriseolus]|uniref:hypothetical protein n=1 Tax=Streptomyces albogriseolus TaxID=1887 RepID=UPI003801A483
MNAATWGAIGAIVGALVTGVASVYSGWSAKREERLAAALQSEEADLNQAFGHCALIRYEGKRYIRFLEVTFNDLARGRAVDAEEFRQKAEEAREACHKAVTDSAMHQFHISSCFITFESIARKAQDALEDHIQGPRTLTHRSTSITSMEKIEALVEEADAARIYLDWVFMNFLRSRFGVDIGMPPMPPTGHLEPPEIVRNPNRWSLDDYERMRTPIPPPPARARRPNSRYFP